MPLVEIRVYLDRHQKQWIETLFKRVKISQAKVFRILTSRHRLIMEGIRGEELQETLSKLHGVSIEKLDELDSVKNLLKKKLKDKEKRIQYFLENEDNFAHIKSMSQFFRFLIEFDMLDYESMAYIGAKLMAKKMDSELKYLKENNKMFENTLPMFRNKQGA